MSQKPTTVQNATLTCTERHDTGPEVARVERYVDAGERDGSIAALELEEAVLLLGLLDRLDGLAVALVDDLAEHLLDLLDGELLRKL